MSDLIVALNLLTICILLWTLGYLLYWVDRLFWHRR